MLKRQVRVRLGGPLCPGADPFYDRRPRPDRPEHFRTCTPDTPEMRALVLEVMTPVLLNMRRDIRSVAGEIYDVQLASTRPSSARFRAGRPSSPPGATPLGIDSTATVVSMTGGMNEGPVFPVCSFYFEGPAGPGIVRGGLGWSV